MRSTLVLASLLIAGCETHREQQAQRWEYTSVSGLFTSASIDGVIGSKSGTAWELVAVPVQQNNDMTFIFKRPVVAEVGE